MGQVVASQVAADPAYTLVGGIVRPGSAAVPLDAIRVETSVEELLPDIDVLIDVSLADATGAMVDACRRFGTPLVCGVTGLDDATMQHMRAAAEHIPVWYARNLSHGVGVLLRMLPALASELAGYDVSIVERHHRHKRDAPSGTALAMARGFTREPGERPIDIQSVRAGGITGEHDVTFTNEFEEIRVSHRALDRAAFAAGAVRAAGMLSDAAPGWYGPES
jgi:4-hydroxy-tetrahydrodipicolinate reductase